MTNGSCRGPMSCAIRARRRKRNCKTPRSSSKTTVSVSRAARRGWRCARHCLRVRNSVTGKPRAASYGDRVMLHHSFSRRLALKSAGVGFGYLAFAGLSTWAAEKENPLEPKKPHFPARAKRVIFLCMEGAPSHVDTFDYKPKLPELDGKSMPRGRGGFGGKVLASPWKFAQHGKSGLWISELFPELAKHADELCLLRGMHTDVPAHSQAFLQMHTGVFQFKRPSMGAWTFYGLGTDNENLPGFVTVSPPLQNGGPANYASAFLPAVYQGTPIRTGFGGFGGGGPPGPGGGGGGVANIRNPRQSSDAQRKQLDFIQSLNQEALEREPQTPRIEGDIRS